MITHRNSLFGFTDEILLRVLYAGGMRRLYIFGAGELASIAYSYFHELGNYEMRGFVIDDEFDDKSNSSVDGVSVDTFSNLSSILTSDDVDVFIAVGASSMNRNRQNVFRRLDALGVTFASYVSPYAFVSSKALIGRNVMIFEHNVVQNGVTIGDNSILWSGNHIGHHTSIGAHCFLSSHVVISGYCKVEQNCYFGVNSTVVDNTTIRAATLVGAASLINRDTDECSVYVGVPAKRIPNRNPFEVQFR